MAEKKKRGRPPIRTAAYWREYYRQKQREWRAVHLYACSPSAVTRVYSIINGIEKARTNGRVLGGVSRSARQTKKRQTVKRGSSLGK